MQRMTVLFLGIAFLIGCDSAPETELQAEQNSNAYPLVSPQTMFSDANPSLSSPYLEQDEESDSSGFQLSRESVDLRKYDSPVRHQGSIGSCTAFAAIAAMENILGRGGYFYDLSERYLWANLQHSVPSLIGPFHALANNPIPLEAECYYSADKANTRCKGLEKGMTAAHLGSNAYYLTSIEFIVQELKNQRPVVMGVSTNKWDNTGVLNTKNSKVDGAHAIAVVGYVRDSGKSGYLIFKNSWGKDWGKRGYGYMPFSYCKKFRCQAISIPTVKEGWTK